MITYKDIDGTVEGCEYCLHKLRLYVPPIYENIPKDRYVCGLFIEEAKQVMYLDNANGMCECFHRLKGE